MHYSYIYFPRRLATIVSVRVFFHFFKPLKKWGLCIAVRCPDLMNTSTSSVVTHDFADVMIVGLLFCRLTSCGNWVLVLRTCALAFLLNLLLLELIYICEFRKFGFSENPNWQIPKIAPFRKIPVLHVQYTACCLNIANITEVTRSVRPIS